MGRFGRLWSAILIPCILLNVAPIVAQTPVTTDTAEAMRLALQAASDPVVGGYFLSGLISAPLAVAPVLVLAAGGRPKPWMAIGPVTFTVTITRASRSNLRLPPEVTNLLSGADSGYSAVFHRTYDETLRRRRRVAVSLGSLTGVAGAVLLLVYGLRDYT